MSSPVIRSESHLLSTTLTVRQDVERTIGFYQKVVRMAATVAITHWPDLAPLRSKERQMVLESLFHATKLRPRVKYPMLGKALGKMPSYLRRAALHHALGAASSFLSNYSNWLDDGERKRGSRPPKLGFSGVYPSLYGGNMITTEQNLKTVCIKLLGADGKWRFTEPLKLHGKLKRLPGKFDLSPSLILEGCKARLSCPVEIKKIKISKTIRRVCAVDVGINTAATLAIVDDLGTVIARKFITCGRHNDRRDNVTASIAGRQQQSHGGSGKRLGAGFCQTLYRRMAGLSKQAARDMARQIMAFALEYEAKAIVVEDLKGWKPKGRGRAQRKRFHRFQHRMLVKCLSHKVEEYGLRLLEIYARGTSRYAYDGSGKVTRAKDNAANATFANGRQYNADLNAAYNIGARGFQLLLGIQCELESAETGKSSGSATRIPFVLANLWGNTQKKAGEKRPSMGVVSESLAADAPTTTTHVV